MRIVGTVMGALVAAVVLIVVAVPILGGLAGSEITIYADEYNDGQTYHYRSLAEPGWTPTSLSITQTSPDLSTDPIVVITWTNTETLDTMEYQITPVSDISIPIIIGETGVVVWPPLLSSPQVAAYGNGTGAISLTNTSYAITNTNNWAIANVSLGSSGLCMCPSEIATHIGGKTIILSDETTIVCSLVRNSGWDNRTVATVISNSNLEIINTISPTESVKDLTVTADRLETEGGTALTMLRASGSLGIPKGWYQVYSTDYMIITPNNPIQISNENEYADLIWLLPVMLAVVLIASVAYQIVPKRRNDE